MYSKGTTICIWRDRRVDLLTAHRPGSSGGYPNGLNLRFRNLEYKDGDIGVGDVLPPPTMASVGNN